MTRLQLQKIKPMLEQIVEEKLTDLLGDPDSGLELTKTLRNRLKKTLHLDSIPADKVAKKLGLHW